MSCVMVLFCSLIQGAVLLAISDRVLAVSLAQQGAILRRTVGRCHDTSTLCLAKGDGASGGYDSQYTCASPVVELVQSWRDLDTDADGAWTSEEASRQRSQLLCPWGVDTTELFAAVLNLLHVRAEQGAIQLDPATRPGGRILEPYFDFAWGDFVMCGYRSADMCPNLVARGLFDVSLETDISPLMGDQVQTALSYCHSLLKEGGLCDQIMPSSYSVWKQLGVEQCGSPVMHPIQLHHPATGHNTSAMAVDYSARLMYARYDDPIFLTVLFSMTFMWVLMLLHSWKDLHEATAWAQPEDSAASLEPLGSAGDGVAGTTAWVRAMLYTMTLLRVLVWAAFALIGTLFLLNSPDCYAVPVAGMTLFFVLSFPQILSTNASHKDLRAGHSPASLGSHGAYDVFMVARAAILAAGAIGFARISTMRPVHDALACTCLAEGAQCSEASAFGRDRWRTYLAGLPRVMSEIERIAAGGAAGPFASSMPPALGRMATAAVQMSGHAAPRRGQRAPARELPRRSQALVATAQAAIEEGEAVQGGAMHQASHKRSKPRMIAAKHHGSAVFRHVDGPGPAPRQGEQPDAGA